MLDLKDPALPPQGILKYTGGPEARILDATWKELARVPANLQAARVVGQGEQTLRVGGSLKIELRTLGSATRISPRPWSP